MQLHQQRVVDEQAELAGRLDRLRVFIGGAIYSALPQDERDRLFRQAIHMRDYDDVLKERIAALEAFEAIPA